LQNLWTAAVSSRSGLLGTELRIELVVVTVMPPSNKSPSIFLNQLDLVGLPTRLAQP
jgi:hypothetical protein